MRVVALHTAEGGFIAEGTIPGFMEPPPVIRWGLRTFKLMPDTHTATCGTYYAETFAYDLPEAVVRDPRQLELHHGCKGDPEQTFLRAPVRPIVTPDPS